MDPNISFQKSKRPVSALVYIINMGSPCSITFYSCSVLFYLFRPKYFSVLQYRILHGLCTFIP